MKLKALFFTLALVIISSFSANAQNATYNEEEFTVDNIELYQIVIFVKFETERLFKKDTVITEIYRTQEEQDKYYRNKKKFISPHQRWLATDLRTFHLTKKEIKTLVNSINKRYNPINTYIPTAFYHDMGLGPHIHIQFKERK